MENKENLSDNDELSLMKSIEEKSDLFKKQLMFAKYFLKCLKLDSNYLSQTVPLHTKLKLGDEEKEEHFNDELYYKFSEFLGLECNISEKEIILFMNNLLLIITKLIEKEMIFSDDLLVLLLEYCNISNNDTLINTIINCASKCLNSNNLRSYHYFKSFLLFNNI